jgi:hypothetical protein
MRIERSNAYHCVFRCDQAIVQDRHRFDVWCSNRYVA